MLSHVPFPRCSFALRKSALRPWGLAACFCSGDTKASWNKWNVNPKLFKTDIKGLVACWPNHLSVQLLLSQFKAVMQIFGVIWPLTYTCGGSKLSHFSSMHPLCTSQINTFKCSITSRVESASHLYKYQRDMQLMNSSGINKNAGLREELWVQLGHWQSSRVNRQRGRERRTGCWSLQQPHSAPSDSDVPPRRPVCKRVKIYSLVSIFRIPLCMRRHISVPLGLSQCR